MLRRVLFIAATLLGAGGLCVHASDTLSTAFDEIPAPLVCLVPIEGMIDGGVAEFMKRAVATAERDSAAALLIEMNTYGGRVDAADEIRSMLLETELRTITFVHNNAASAGALIAIATDSIAMAPGSAIGAATPVDQSGTPASSKVISYFRSLMGETARAKGRDPRIAEAMVDSTIVVAGWEDAPRPLTLRSDQAIEIGIAQHEARNVEAVLEHSGLAGAEILRIEPNWAERVVRFLTNPMISGLLMTIGGLGLIYELTSPGFGVAGMAGLACLSLFFGAHYIVDLAEWTEMLIFLAGIVLVVVELFVPGGIVGTVGVGLMFAGLFLSLIGKIDFVMPGDLSGAFTTVGMALILTTIGAAILLRGFAELPLVRRLTLSTRQQPGKGDGVAVDARSELVGMTGVAQTDLRPAGRVHVDDRYYDATTDGDHISEGSAVTVIRVDGLSGVIVRAT